MEIKYEITECLGVLSERKSGWQKEFNLVNWNEKGDKFDIREWSPDHSKMGKGITLSEDELFKLYALLKAYFHEGTSIATSKGKENNIQDLLFK